MIGKLADSPDTRSLSLVRAGFIADGTTFAQWSRSQGIDPSYARKTVLGILSGPAALKLRPTIFQAAGVTNRAAR